MNLQSMSKKDYLMVFLKGILLGLISVGIPGISASTIGIIVGIYYLMVESIANIFKDFKHNFPFLIILMLGYGVGAVGAAATVSILFEYFPLLTTFIILGLLFGSMPDMIKDLKGGFKKVSNWIVLVTIVVFLLVYNFTIQKNAEITFPENPTWGFLAIMVGVGFVTSATFVIPGVDFAVVFMSMGIYYAFTNMILDLVSFGSPDYFVHFLSSIKILGAYLVGYLAGMFLISKLIKHLSTKFESQSKFASFAFIVASPIILVKMCIYDNPAFNIQNVKVTEIIIGQVLLILALWLTIYISKINREKKMLKETGSTVDNRLHLDRRLRKVFFKKFFTAIWLHIHLKKLIKKPHTTEDAYKFCIEYVDQYFELMDVEIRRHGVENIEIPGGVMFMGNHQGKNDALLVLDSIKEHPSTFLINDDRSHAFLIGRIVDYMGAKRIKFNDLKAQATVYREMAKELSAGNSFLVFPEAMYRDNKNSLLVFNAPCFQPAIKSQCPIVPFVLYNSWMTSDDDIKGHLVVDIYFLKPIYYEEYQGMLRRDLAILTRSRIEEKLAELNKDNAKLIDDETLDPLLNEN